MATTEPASPVDADGRLTACPECGCHHYTITEEMGPIGELPPDRMWLVCDDCETAWWWHVTFGEVTKGS